MGSIEVKRKMGKITVKWITCMCIVSILIVVYYTFYSFSYTSNLVDVSNLRIKYADAVAYAEAGEYEKLNVYEWAIIGLDSNVICTNSSHYKVGQKINLHSLSTGNSINDRVRSNQFVSPIIGGNSQIGTLVILIQDANKDRNNRIWLGLLLPIIFLSGIICCGIRLYRYIRNDVVEPVNVLSYVAEEILKGNYQKAIRYDSENEVGRLYRKMELMRDELQNSSEQTKKYHENEKMILACISHDLKTPIATISGCAEGIRDGVVKNTSDIERYVGIILNKSELLTKLINDILDHTNAELDELSLTRQEVYARQFIMEVLAELAPDVQGSELEFKADEIPDVLLNIAPDRIFQVFQNIIGNSIKYTPKGGFIHIKFEQCSDALAVEISDNGQGIVATDIPFVFDRFYRGEKARTQKEICGSGLGLSIVRSIIERHGGRVECDSVLGQGTTIRFLLPII